MTPYSPPYPALAVANYFIEAANLEAREMTQMKLQKLVYIAHGWHLAVIGRPLLSEPVEAWKFGPVLRSVRNATRPFGREPIRSPLRPSAIGTTPAVYDETTKRFLADVWDLYKRYGATRLMEMTHQPDSPWSEAYTTHKDGAIIEDRKIKAYYTRLLNERRATASGETA